MLASESGLPGYNSCGWWIDRSLIPSLWRSADGVDECVAELPWDFEQRPVRWRIHSMNHIVVQEPPAMTNYSQSHPYQLDSIPSYPTPWSFILSVRKFYLSVNPISPVSVRFLVSSYHMYSSNIWFVIEPQLLKKGVSSMAKTRMDSIFLLKVIILSAPTLLSRSFTL